MCDFCEKFSKCRTKTNNVLLNVWNHVKQGTHSLKLKNYWAGLRKDEMS